MAFVGLKSKSDVLMLIQTILLQRPINTQIKPTHFLHPPFHSPTAPAPLSSGAEIISCPSPPLGSSLLRTSLLKYPSVSNRCEFPCMTGSLTLSVRPCTIITPIMIVSQIPRRQSSLTTPPLNMGNPYEIIIDHH